MSRPFLTIVTRSSQRPAALLHCVRTVIRQTDLDAEQLFLVDRQHRGLLYANQQFYRYRNFPRGRYVWALDDDNLMSDQKMIARLKLIAQRADPDVILVKMSHEHTHQVHPAPSLWSLDWEGGERPDYWVGGGACVVVKRAVWAEHTSEYYNGQGEDWATGGDWHFITSLIEDPDLTFAQCDAVVAKQPERGYGRTTEDCPDDWFERVSQKLGLEHIARQAYRLDYTQGAPTCPETAEVIIDYPLNILQCAKWDWAGCASFLADAINKHTIHNSRAIRWQKDNRFEFPTDVVAPSSDELYSLWSWADIVHIHDHAPIPGRFPPKPTVITMHGSKYRTSFAKYHRVASRRGWLLTVATPDLTAKRGVPWMPDTRTGLPPKQKGSNTLTVLHCPSIRANKQTGAVIDALKGMSQVEFRLIEDLLWEECIEIKASAGRAVLVDQFEWGYGCNAIEAWAYGIPVIANAVGEARKAFKSMFGYFPFLQATPQTLSSAILSLLDPKVYRNVQDMGVAHYMRYHEPAAAANAALAFYARVRDRKEVKDAEQELDAPLGKPGLTLLRYRGRNFGRMTFTGPATGQRYYFSAAARDKYVDGRDVAGMLSIQHHTRDLFEVIDG